MAMVSCTSEVMAGRDLMSTPFASTPTATPCFYPWQELADLAVEQMQGVIHVLVRKGTTSSLRAKVCTYNDR